MFWIVETNSGSFEGERLKVVIYDIIDYYAEEGWSPQIESIIGVYSNEQEKEICSRGLTQIQYFIDEGVEEAYKEIQEEIEHQRQLRADYYSNLL